MLATIKVGFEIFLRIFTNSFVWHFVLSIVAAVVCFILCLFGVLTVIDQYQNDIRETTIMAPFTFWITAVVPFGLFLLGFQFIRRGVRALLGLQLAVDPNLEEEG